MPTACCTASETRARNDAAAAAALADVDDAPVAAAAGDAERAAAEARAADETRRSASREAFLANCTADEYGGGVPPPHPLLTHNRYFQVLFRRAAHALGTQQRLLLVDTPHDGSCAVHSVLHAVRRALGDTRMHVDVARHLLVAQLAAPEFSAELAFDARESAALADEHFESAAAMRHHFARPGTHMNPLHVARALERLSGGGRVRVWTIDATETLAPVYGDVPSPGPWLTHSHRYTSDGDGPFIAELYHDQRLVHTCRAAPMSPASAAAAAAPLLRTRAERYYEALVDEYVGTCRPQTPWLILGRYLKL